MDELKTVIEELGRTFEGFKAANDARLAEIEKKGYPASDIDEKIAKLNDAINDLTKQKDTFEAEIQKQILNGGGGKEGQTPAEKEYKNAFAKFMRAGIDIPKDIQAALTTQVDEDGGFAVPEESAKTIDRVVSATVAMRRLASVIRVGSVTYKKLVNVGGTSSGWVGEEQSIAETQTPTLKALEFPIRIVYAEPATTQVMLDDAFFDVESWLAGEIALEFAEREDESFVSGEGVINPRGFLSYTPVANASYSWGNIGFIKSGGSGSFANSDCLIDLQHALKPAYRRNGTWLMSDTTIAEIRKLKDGEGNYIWKPGLISGQPATILAKPVVSDDFMPEMASNSYSIAFADWKRAYVITDRMGIRTLRDAYTNKPNVKFYTTKRVGGGIQNFEAIKLMKFAA